MSKGLYEKVRDLQTLSELDEYLTGLMAGQKIQPLLKEKGLIRVIDTVIALSKSEGEGSMLHAAAIIGRLSGVAKHRRDEVYERIDDLFTSKPGKIEDLSDADQKLYVARALGFSEEEWAFDYCVEQALIIDSADTARKQLLEVALEKVSDFDVWISRISSEFPKVSEFSNSTSYLRRVRRIFSSILEVLRGRISIKASEVGGSLVALSKAALDSEVSNAEVDVLYSTVDNLLDIAARVVETKFSIALDAETFEFLWILKRRVGRGEWQRYLRYSSSIGRISDILGESALILARQGKTDEGLMNSLLHCFVSRPQYKSVVSRYFDNAPDLDSNVKDWWVTGGQSKMSSDAPEQPIGNEEDRQIGELMIEIDQSKHSIDVMLDSVVPVLEMEDDVAAATVKKAALAFKRMANIVNRLGRMRNLSKTCLIEKVMDYKPREHEMLGGHVPGIRRVRVVRDGIQKEFGHRILILTKPHVESI